LAPIAKGYSGASQRIFDTGSRLGGTVSVSSPTQDISSLKPPAYAWGFLSCAPICLLGLVLIATIILVIAPGAVTWALALIA